MCIVICHHVYLCIMYVPGAHGAQKRALNSLGLELETIVSCLVWAGN